MPDELVSDELVPVIDISGWTTGDPDERRRIVEAVDAACRRVGFLQIIGHGVPQPVIDAMVAAADAFFALPEPSKMLTIRADVDQVNNGTSYTRVTPHIDAGGRVVVRYKPTERFYLEDAIIVRNRTLLKSSLYFRQSRSRRASSSQIHVRNRSLAFSILSRAASVCPFEPYTSPTNERSGLVGYHARRVAYVNAPTVVWLEPYSRVTLAPGIRSHEILLSRNGSVSGAFIQ